MCSLNWITSEELACLVTVGPAPLLIDMRSCAQYSVKHIKEAHNLSFSPILVRRMLKGSIALDSLITDHDLLQRLASSGKVVLYDNCSCQSETRPELVRFAEILMSRFGAANLALNVLDGGINSFYAVCPQLCTTLSAKGAASPSRVTLDTASIRAMREQATPEATPVEVLPFLFLGSARDSSDLKVLKRMNITSVLNITTTCPNHFESEFEYMSILVEDSHQTDLLSRLNQAIEFIESVREKGGRVFVHCHAGISRSATVCIAYMMRTRKMSVEEAYRFVKSKRPIISPNLHFMGQLLEYQKQLFTLTLESVPERLPATTCTTTATKITTPVQSISKTLSAHFSTTNEESSHDFSSAYASEANAIAILTNKLQHANVVGYDSRSFRIPLGECCTSTSSGTTTSRRPSRESLKLCLSSPKPVAMRSLSSPQLSPCRIEATITNSPLAQSLTFTNTTCT